MSEGIGLLGIPPLQNLGLFEYHLDTKTGSAKPDISMPMPREQPSSDWENLAPLLQSVETCLQASGNLLSNPWLEFDQPGHSRPGIFLQLHSELDVVLPALIQLQKDLGLSPLDKHVGPLGLPKGVIISHVGLFPGRGDGNPQSSHWLRLNLVGSAAGLWEWLTSNLQPHLLGKLPFSGLMEANPSNCPGQLAWSPTFDWNQARVGRIGLEIFPSGRLQRGSPLGDPAVADLLLQLNPICPAESIHVLCRRHQLLLPRRFRAGFSHIKLTPSIQRPDHWASKLYLLAHATG